MSLSIYRREVSYTSKEGAVNELPREKMFPIPKQQHNLSKWFEIRIKYDKWSSTFQLRKNWTQKFNDINYEARNNVKKLKRSLVRGETHLQRMSVKKCKKFYTSFYSHTFPLHIVDMQDLVQPVHCVHGLIVHSKDLWLRDLFCTLLTASSCFAIYFHWFTGITWGIKQWYCFIVYRLQGKRGGCLSHCMELLSLPCPHSFPFFRFCGKSLWVSRKVPVARIPWLSNAWIDELRNKNI